MSEYENPSYGNQPLNPYDYEGTTGERRGCRNWAIGCSIALILFLGVLAIGGYYVAVNFKSWTSETVVMGVEQGLEEMDLSVEQKQQIMTRVEELAEDFASGEVTFEEMAEMGQKIVESRTIIAGGAEFIVSKMIEDKMELDEERQAEVDRLVQRLARGIVEEKLEQDDFEPLLEIVMEKKGEGKYEVKNNISQEELEQFLVELRTLVDNAEIPDEPYEVDIAAEIDRIMESARDEE